MIAAGGLLAAAVGCSADASNYWQRETTRAPQTLKVPEQAVTRLAMSTPAVDVQRLSSFVVLPGGRLVVAQSDPGRVFAGSIRDNGVEWLKEVGRTQVVTDIAWHESKGLLVLDSLASEFRLLSLDGTALATFTADHFERASCFATDGTVLSTSFSDGLLRHTDTTGRLLKKVGERFAYENRDLDFTLNAGRLACSGNEVYIAFVHPAVVRAYSLRGPILWEHALALEGDPIPPVIQRTRPAKGLTTLNSRYSIAALDVAADDESVYVLKSGEEMRAAISQGSNRIEVLARDGSHRAELQLPFRAHRLRVVDGNMFLLTPSPPSLRRIRLSDIGMRGP